MRFICELREGEPISGIYLCKNKQNLKTKAGKSYYSMILQDKTGTVDAKIWELNNGIEHFESLDFIKIDGQWDNRRKNKRLLSRSCLFYLFSPYPPSWAWHPEKIPPQK